MFSSSGLQLPVAEMTAPDWMLLRDHDDSLTMEGTPVLLGPLDSEPSEGKGCATSLPQCLAGCPVPDRSLLPQMFAALNDPAHMNSEPLQPSAFDATVIKASYFSEPSVLGNASCTQSTGFRFLGKGYKDEPGASAVA